MKATITTLSFILAFLISSCSGTQKKPDIDYSLSVVEDESIEAQADISFNYSIIEADLSNSYVQDGHVFTNQLDLCLWGALEVTIQSECHLAESACNVCVDLPNYSLCFDIGGNDEGATE